MHPIQAAEDELHAIITALENEGHALAARARAAFDALKADVPQLEHDAKADAADVVKTAETQGLIPAEQAAVTDAAQLGGEVVKDLEDAATAQPTPAEPTA